MPHGAAFSGPAVSPNPPVLPKTYEIYGLAGSVSELKPLGKRGRRPPAFFAGAPYCSYSAFFPSLRGERERKAQPLRAFRSTWNNENPGAWNKALRNSPNQHRDGCVVTTAENQRPWVDLRQNFEIPIGIWDFRLTTKKCVF